MSLIDINFPLSYRHLKFSFQQKLFKRTDVNRSTNSTARLIVNGLNLKITTHIEEIFKQLAADLKIKPSKFNLFKKNCII